MSSSTGSFPSSGFSHDSQSSETVRRPPLTGPISEAMLDEFRRYVIMDPWPFAVDLSRCHDSYLVTMDGAEILDFGGYYGSKLIAHNHPDLSDPAYVRRLVTAANNKIANPDFLTPECLDYYRLLHALAPAIMQNHAIELYAVNSGAEAIENMMKYLINLHDEKQLARGRLVGTRRFIYFDSAFHGRTIFALNVTQLPHDPLMTEDFRGLVPGNLQVPFPAIDTDAPDEENAARASHSLNIVEDCLRRYGDEIVGIIVEPIQGAGGHRVAPKAFFQGLSRLAHQYDTYLAFDEVQTAGGQLGTMFAIDQYDLPYPPQAVAVGKKFANGAVYMLHTMDDQGILDSTWGGTLADMVRFVQEMEIVRRERLIEQVPEKSDRLVAGLQRLAGRYSRLIGNVRGLGLYQGFTTRTHGAGTLVDIALQSESLLLLSAGPATIRLRPTLSVTHAEIDLMLETLDRSLERLGQLPPDLPPQPAAAISAADPVVGAAV